MSSGVYGTIKGADFDPQDAEIWLSYRANRTVAGDGFSKVETNKYLSTETDTNSNQISGLYQLKLPLDTFNKVGIYNVYIRPKQIEATIKDIGVLSSYPDIRGIVIDTTSISGSSIDNDSLVGYRIEYKDTAGAIKQNLFRIITSNNKCEATSQTTNGTTSYRFNDSSTLTFMTITPSSASSARPLSLPYIGSIQDSIVLSNTFFNPEMVEIEMTENDLESLYTSINGDQIRNLDKGLVTTYDSSKNIVNQVEHYIIKESATGTPIYEIKQNQSTIYVDNDYNTIVGEV
jgi:hypothetical protein